MMNKATSAEDYKLSSSYESIRRKLLAEKYSDRMDKPLAYWALPNDRRLPLVLMGRTLGDLLSRPFDELSSTPGIGQKKISSLVKLLLRATKDDTPAVPFGISELGDDGEEPTVEAKQFDPDMVSESMWAQWKQTVVRHGLADEKLGRLAPTLEALPTVIWHTPLGFYLEHSLADIRELKTHGEKRVRVVLEVFHLLHESLESAVPPSHLEVRLTPKFIGPVQAWIESVIESETAPDEAVIEQQLVVPLLNQIKVDAGPTVHRLAEGRLGLRGKPVSVRGQSQKMGVTRARIYQLLDECGRVMQVRWPDGRCRLMRLKEHLDASDATAEQRRLFDAVRDLLFPEKFGEEEDAD